ncbi:alkaline phosphatase family protein [Pontixanthobacter gangjinensis]|uniref:Alkaline phosphatase family protein n=1 Tax=Christiangramia aestuarii TaxID=1028746 RepID=A0A7M3SYN0_9FLAO|nr:alkaline phosphatase PafA [Christiangramia aestuarii]MUP41711.1 alkaline phosphatase family protein [Christiangramia aestuarii]
MKRYLLAFSFLVCLGSLNAQIVNEKPKLVVGIVVDQMRYDYLTRFWDQFGNDGFKRLVNNGYTFKNTHFNYVPTYTGPGHASVFTGTTPAYHGIISNSWFNKFEGQFVYCVNDSSVKSVGTQTRAGEMSPNRMLSTTFADENRLHTQMKGKTIGVALKDRGAILPAGHTANAAYWFEGGSEANWITSTYYMQELPEWVQKFNASDRAESYLKTWEPLREISTYSESGVDANDFEGGFNGKETATFPYDLKKLAADNGNYNLIKATPFGNDLTAEFAKAAIKGESLGQDDITDVLTLSFSSTDYVGHNFGVNSKEVQDTYIRLDLAIADVLKYLDQNVGEGEYTVFLTADHGAVDVPNYLKSRKIPAGNFSDSDLISRIGKFVSEEFNSEDLIENISNNQVFFNYEELQKKKLDSRELQEKLSHFILQQDNISRVFTREQLESGSFDKGIGSLIENGYHQKRSGDLVYVLDPGFIVFPETGTTHGSGFSYDTHAPLIFFGKGIKKGSTYSEAYINDIAPTISALLGIAFPNAATGKPLYIMLDK